MRVPQFIHWLTQQRAPKGAIQEFADVAQVAEVLAQQIPQLVNQVATLAGTNVAFELMLKDAGIMTEERMALVKEQMQALFKQPDEGEKTEPPA